MVEIEIMPIEQLLRMSGLYNRDKTIIIFITTKPDYYSFGDTTFVQLNIADTNAPAISREDFNILGFVARMKGLYDTIFVCCDAGLSRSPAVAHFLAIKLQEFDRAREIEKKYRFLNNALYEKLMEKIA